MSKGTPPSHARCVIIGGGVIGTSVAYHLANGGISRYEKFRYYYVNILKKKINIH